MADETLIRVIVEGESAERQAPEQRRGSPGTRREDRGPEGRPEQAIGEQLSKQFDRFHSGLDILFGRLIGSLRDTVSSIGKASQRTTAQMVPVPFAIPVAEPPQRSARQIVLDHTLRQIELLPQMASGGTISSARPGRKFTDYPVAKPYAPPPEPVVTAFPASQRIASPLPEKLQSTLGAEGKVKFSDPLSQLSDAELLKKYSGNKPLPLPTNDVVPSSFAEDWNIVSRLMPELASGIKQVSNFTEEQLEDFRQRGFRPRASINTASGHLRIDPRSVTAGSIWHELVHMDQHKRGELLKKSRMDASGQYTSHGRLMESEAYQRGNFQGAEVVGRLRKMLGGSGAIVGDLPGQSMESIKRDPHTEVVMGNQVIPHKEAERHGLFDAQMPRHATGGKVNQALDSAQKMGVRGLQPFVNVASGISEGMAVAGPVGGVVGGVLTAIHEVSEAFNGAVGAAGQFAATMISANPSITASISATSAQVKSFGESIFLISPAASAVVSALGSFGQALGTVMEQMDGMVDRYAMFSPELAQGQAMTDIRQQMGDFARAQQAAPALLEYMRARSELQQKFEDMKIRLLQQITPTVLRGMEIFEQLMPLLEVSFGVIVQCSNFVLGWRPPWLNGDQPDTLEEIRRLLDSPEGANLPTTQIRRPYDFSRLNQYRSGNRRPNEVQE